MAVKKKVPPQPLDPAVESAASTPLDPVYGELASRRQRARSMTKGQRKKADADAKRSRAMFDLPPELLALLSQTAEAHSVPQSQVAAYLMIAGAQAIAAGSVPHFRALKRPSKSMRFDWNLDLPEIPKTRL